MKQAIKWVANDGTEFSVFSDCEKYEVLCEAVSEAMKSLAPKPDGCDFANGSGYIAHTQAGLDAAIASLAAAALDFYPKGGTTEEWFSQWRDGERHVSHVARLVNDGREKCLDAALYRLMCIDGQLREWGQPYYAAYPDQAKNVCLNQPAKNSGAAAVLLACILAAVCVGCGIKEQCAGHHEAASLGYEAASRGITKEQLHELIDKGVSIHKNCKWKQTP